VSEDGDEGERGHAGVLRIFPPVEGAARIVLVRHGEAECNLNRVLGGRTGCTGLTDLGRVQVAALADRLYESGELREATALYSSVLPRAGAIQRRYGSARASRLRSPRSAARTPGNGRGTGSWRRSGKPLEPSELIGRTAHRLVPLLATGKSYRHRPVR